MINRTMKKFILAGALVLGGMIGALPAGAEEVDKIYSFYCAQCHGMNGDGKGINVTDAFPATPRAFNNAEQMSKLTDADIRNVVREGGPIANKSAMMPPWGKTLSDAEIDALVKKLRVMCKCEGKQG